MLDTSALLLAREQCEKNIFYKELMRRILNEKILEMETVSNGIRLGFPMIKFYQGKKAGFDRVLLMPDEIIKDSEAEEDKTG